MMYFLEDVFFGDDVFFSRYARKGQRARKEMMDGVFFSWCIFLRARREMLGKCSFEGCIFYI